MKYFKLVLFIVFALFSFSFAEENLAKSTPDKKGNYREDLQSAVGFGAGFVSGFGISYRYWNPDKLGYQITFAPYYGSGSGFISFGVLGLKQLTAGDWNRLFSYFGGSIYMPFSRDNLDLSVNLGGGFGMEIFITENIGLNLMGGLGFFNTHVVYKQWGTNSYYEDWSPSWTPAINLTGETGLFYKF
jgi:hypothetical protein